MTDFNDDSPETGDPRFPGLSAETVEAASKAHCVRCAIRIVDAPSLAGTVFVSFMVPSVSVRDRAMLCGACGLAFREFLYPYLADDDGFQYARTRLLGEHW